MTKPHHNTGNTYAKKERSRSDHLHGRVYPEDKAAWKREAESKGLSLMAWVQEVLNREVNRNPSR